MSEIEAAKSLVVVAEDEPRIAEILRDYLELAGFAVQCFDDGREALGGVRQLNPALVLLDLMLPGLDGLDVCREVRRFSNVPIIMVTARVEEIDRLLGLELGADDYICKPFSPREVVARVKTILRRVRLGASVEECSPPLFTVDELGQRISVTGVALSLTATEYRILQVFIGQPGRVFSRSQLMERAARDDSDAFDRAIDSHIKNLRKKIAAVLPGREVIHAVYGVGYRFEP